MLVRPAMKRIFYLKAKNGLGRFAPSALPHYYKNTLFTYIPAPIRPYLPAVLYTMVGCACRVSLRMTKGVVFIFPYRTAIRSGLTYIILGAIRTYLQYETIHRAWLVVFALWNGG